MQEGKQPVEVVPALGHAVIYFLGLAAGLDLQNVAQDVTASLEQLLIVRDHRVHPE